MSTEGSQPTPTSEDDQQPGAARAAATQRAPPARHVSCYEQHNLREGASPSFISLNSNEPLVKLVSAIERENPYHQVTLSTRPQTHWFVNEVCDSPWQLLPLLLTTMIGPSNLTTFANTMWSHGGILFLLPYCLCLVLYSLPVMQIETYIGQFTRAVPYRAYHLFAPFMTAISFTGQLGLIGNGAQVLQNLAIAFKLWLSDELTEMATCRPDQAFCISYLNDKNCAPSTEYYRGACRKMVHGFVDFEMVSLPTIEFLKKNLTNYSEDPLHSIDFNWSMFAIAIVASVLVSALMLTHIRIIACVAMVLQGLALMLLVLLTQLARSGLPEQWNKQQHGSHFDIRSPERLLKIDTWRYALIMCLRSQALGQGVIPAIGVYAPSRRNILKWIIMAALGDLLSSLIYTYYFDGLLIMFSERTIEMVSPHDFLKDDISMLFGLPMQSLSYYGEPKYVRIHALLICVLMFNSLISIAISQHQFLRSFFPFERRAFNGLLTAGCLIITSIPFLYANFEVAVKIYLSSRLQLAVVGVMLTAVMMIACYGMEQCWFDHTRLMEPLTRSSQKWRKLCRRLLGLYQHAVPVASFLIIASVFQFGGDGPQFDLLMFASIASFIIFPGWYLYMGWWNELMTVQPGLPSYKLLRVPLIR